MLQTSCLVREPAMGSVSRWAQVFFTQSLRNAPAIAVPGDVGAVLAKVRAMPDVQGKQTTTATRTGSSSKRRNTGYRMSGLARAPWLRLGEMGAPCEQF
jgi:hypothetical protein